MSMQDLTPEQIELECLLTNILNHLPADYKPKGWPAIQMRDLTLLAREVRRLQQWKADANEVESRWDAQAIGQLIGVPVGSRIRPAIQPAIEKLQARVKELEFQPPGYESPISLPVITKGSRKDTGAWTWNGSTEAPTLKPSVKTQHSGGLVSHIWLTDGMCQYLSDSTCGNAGNVLPLQPLEPTDAH